LGQIVILVFVFLFEIAFLKQDVQSTDAARIAANGQ